SLLALERAQRVHAQAAFAQPRGAAEVGKVDDEAAANDVATRAFDQFHARERSAAGGDQVVDHEHALAAVDRVGVDLDAVGAVLEVVVDADRRVRELAGLAHGDEARLERDRDGAAEDEAARFDAGDLDDTPP